MRWTSGPTPTGGDRLCLPPLRSRSSRGRSAPDASGDSFHQQEVVGGRLAPRTSLSAPLAVRGSLPDPDSGVLGLRRRSIRTRHQPTQQILPVSLVRVRSFLGQDFD